MGFATNVLARFRGIIKHQQVDTTRLSARPQSSEVLTTNTLDKTKKPIIEADRKAVRSVVYGSVYQNFSLFRGL